VEQFADLNKDFDSQLAQRIALEAMLIKLSKIGMDFSIDTILDKLLQIAEGGLPPGLDSVATPATPKPPVQAGPPPRPTEAAPALAPPAPAAPRRLVVRSEDVLRVWPRIQSAAQERSLKAGVWLGQATPTGVEGDHTLVLSFPADAQKQREIIERPENRAVVEQALVEVTQNLTAIRTELTAARAAETVVEAAVRSDLPYHPMVHPDDAKAVLEDPQVAHLLEVFKGRIAMIRRPVAAIDEATEAVPVAAVGTDEER